MPAGRLPGSRASKLINTSQPPSKYTNTNLWPLFGAAFASGILIISRPRPRPKPPPRANPRRKPRRCMPDIVRTSIQHTLGIGHHRHTHHTPAVDRIVAVELRHRAVQIQPRLQALFIRGIDAPSVKT